MFASLSDRLGDVFARLRRRGALKESDVTAALREVRVALLEADVALPVVKDFISAVSQRAVGEEVLRSITPAQMVVKIVNDFVVIDTRGAPIGDGAGIVGGDRDRRAARVDDDEIVAEPVHLDERKPAHRGPYMASEAKNANGFGHFHPAGRLDCSPRRAYIPPAQ